MTEASTNWSNVNEEIPEWTTPVSFACHLGESPLWDHRTDTLYWIDSLEGRLHALKPDTGETQNWGLLSKVGSIGLCNSGRLLVALEDTIELFDPVTGRKQVFASLGPLPDGCRLNDGKVCSSGRYWVGSVSEFKRPDGALYRVEPTGKHTEVRSGITVSNGLAFVNGDHTLYFADTPTRKIQTFNHDPATGGLSNESVFVDFGELPGRPDGAVIDTDGNYWVAMVRGGAVGCFSPQGNLLRLLKLPVEHPTMCAFGGKNLDCLYVTSTQHLLQPGDAMHQPLAGALFCLRDIGAQGIENSVFSPSEY